MKHFGEFGTPIVTYLRVKVFALENKSCTLRVLRPKSGKGWDSAGVETMLTEIGADLERRFPSYEYRRVQVGPLSFNFIFVGEKKVPVEGVKDGATAMGLPYTEQSET